MTKVPPADFSPHFVITMKSALAVHRIVRSYQTLATKARTAQGIVSAASELVQWRLRGMLGRAGTKTTEISILP